MPMLTLPTASSKAPAKYGIRCKYRNGSSFFLKDTYEDRGMAEKFSEKYKGYYARQSHLKGNLTCEVVQVS